jgi:urease accessory protein
MVRTAMVTRMTSPARVDPGPAAAARSQLHLLHLSSPALPIGAYAYSQALEYAIEAAWLEGGALEAWLKDGLELGLARLELPLMLRVHGALQAEHHDVVDGWNDFLLASRETHELLLEDQQVGKALWRLLATLAVPGLPELHQQPGYAVAFAVACQRWEIEPGSMLQAFSFSWLENQVTAATKLVPLGQSQAQQMLLRLLESVPVACDCARQLGDEDLGLSLPGLALASCRHERQHTRLFRS